MGFRVKIAKKGKSFYILEQPKLKASTKQLLYQIIREELDVKRIYIRRNSLFCSE